jgi:hypothetical protein
VGDRAKLTECHDGLSSDMPASTDKQVVDAAGEALRNRFEQARLKCFSMAEEGMFLFSHR